MIRPRLFLCSDAKVSDDDPLLENRHVVELASYGPNQNVNIRLEDVSKVLLKHLSPRVVDFLEIASYVFTADAATSRGEGWSNTYTVEPWGRDLSFVIPVRDLDFWSGQDVQQLLVRLLNFLSDDSYNFNFQQLSGDRPAQHYLDFGKEEDWPFYGVDRVLMFSGGLDSLAGAVESAKSGEELVLVSHRPVAKLSKRQRQLFDELRKTFEVPMIHVPVWVNKDKGFGREHTQRTRSLLYTALGTVVAESIRAEGVRFFENGIVSLNLPIADEVLRARASRTTHPFVLQLLTELCTLMTEREFVVDNPFLFKTKTEVVSSISILGAGHLIQHTCSCARTGFFQSKTQRHCGTCSQCIDRRFAILASDQDENDPEIDYVSDVFTGPREDGYEKSMAVNFVRHALELHLMGEEELATKFNLELSRAVRYLKNSGKAAERFIEIHKKHAETVYSILERQLKRQAAKILDGSLADNSMLAMVVGQRHLEPSWKLYCERIMELLKKGLPIACKTKKPENEPHLQEISDGILKARDGELIREFPFVRWSSSLTKPDWSAESFNLWVEAKYVRQRKDVYRITEEIAADITKYGDSNRRVLFVVYDPNHIITNEEEFSEPILKREGMLVDFVR